MTPKDLLKEIRKDMRETARKFITAKPPHPNEIIHRKEKLSLPCEGKSDYDNITLERERVPQGGHVNQNTSAVGVVFNGPDQEEKSLLGTWSRDEFQLEPAPSMEMA